MLAQRPAGTTTVTFTRRDAGRFLAASLLLIACDDHLWRQVGQHLIDRGNRDDWRHHAAENPDDTLQHGFGAERQQRLRRAHPRGLAAAENYRAGLHGFR